MFTVSTYNLILCAHCAHALDYVCVLLGLHNFFLVVGGALHFEEVIKWTTWNNWFFNAQQELKTSRCCWCSIFFFWFFFSRLLNTKRKLYFSANSYPILFVFTWNISSYSLLKTNWKRNRSTLVRCVCRMEKCYRRWEERKWWMFPSGKNLLKKTVSEWNFSESIFIRSLIFHSLY